MAVNCRMAGVDSDKMLRYSSSEESSLIGFNSAEKCLELKKSLQEGSNPCDLLELASAMSRFETIKVCYGL